MAGKTEIAEVLRKFLLFIIALQKYKGENKKMFYDQIQLIINSMVAIKYTAFKEI